MTPIAAADRRRVRPPQARRGFTLVELLVAMVVVAILVAIAVPSYSAYVVRSKRAAARTALLQDAQFMERIYTVAGCYSNIAPPCQGAPITSLPLPYSNAPAEGTASYTVALANFTAQTYTLQATPIPGTFADPVCGSLTLDQTGAKGVSTGSTATLIDTCWQR